MAPRLPQSAPESAYSGAPELKPRVEHPFGRALSGAGFGAARGALPNRALQLTFSQQQHSNKLDETKEKKKTNQILRGCLVLEAKV